MRKKARTWTWSTLAVTAALVTVPVSGVAQQGTKPFAYQPPLRGAPSSSVRVGGGTRGDQQRTFSLSVLAPDHVGHTIREQPTLYWFNSEPIDAPAELTIVEAEGFDTLLQIQLDAPVAAGVHALPLGDHGVRLKPEVTYQWFVAMVLNPDQRSSDVSAAGEILRVEPPPGIANAAGAPDSSATVGALAQAGLWYDALDGLSRLIASTPGDPALREQRASLLDQVGLTAAASWERRGER